MIEFRYRAASETGRVEQGWVSASSADEALRQLEERRLTVFELTEKSALALGRPARGRIGHDDRVVLVRELATLASAGISLAEALQTLSEANAETPLAAPLERMVSAIRSGEGFSGALSGAGLALPEYVHAMVRAGEATGHLGPALARAADQMDFDARMRAQAREALTYPLILISTGTAAILFIFSFVVPRFAGLLRGRMDTLPWISELVLKTGMFFNAHLIPTLVGLGLVLTGAIMLARQPGVRRGALEISSRLPVLGAWIQSAETARWTSALSVLLQSRVAILTALELASTSVRLADTAARLEKVRDEVNRGRRLSQAIEHQQLLEPTSLSMVRVGEQSGELPDMFQHVSRYWRDKNQALQRRMVSLVEPTSILLLGLIIGFVMVGVVLAMASLSEVKL